MKPIAILALQQTLGVGLKTIDKILSLPDIQEPANPSDIIDILKIASEKFNRIVIPDIQAATISWNKACEIIKNSRQHNIQIISKESPNYPKCLLRISDSPILLHVKGNLEALNKDCIAIVGTRKPTEFGANQAKKIARDFVKEGYVVVSGLADGIDSAAHMGALDAKGLTVAVLAHGLDTIYPYKNKQLADTILKNNGALVSEYPVGTKIFRNNFVDRDRIQSGLSLGVVVIETGIKGGTMHTVKFCETQKRILIVLQHPEDVPEKSKSYGNTQLIAENRANIVYGNEFNAYLIKDKLKNKKEELMVSISSDQMSPQVLFKENISPSIKEKKRTRKNYLFRWNEIPGNDNERLIKFLRKEYGVPWVNTANIEKINDDKTISLSNENNSLLLTLEYNENKASLKISTIDEFVVRKANGDINIIRGKKGLNSNTKLQDFGLTE